MKSKLKKKFPQPGFEPTTLKKAVTFKKRYKKRVIKKEWYHMNGALVYGFLKRLPQNAQKHENSEKS